MKLIDFLKEESILKEFLDNFKNDRVNKKSNADVEKFLQLSSSCLSNAFIWQHAKEGKKFWQDKFIEYQKKKSLQ